MIGSWLPLIFHWLSSLEAQLCVTNAWGEPSHMCIRPPTTTNSPQVVRDTRKWFQLTFFFISRGCHLLRTPLQGVQAKFIDIVMMHHKQFHEKWFRSLSRPGHFSRSVRGWRRSYRCLARCWLDANRHQDNDFSSGVQTTTSEGTGGANGYGEASCTNAETHLRRTRTSHHFLFIRGVHPDRSKRRLLLVVQTTTQLSATGKLWAFPETLKIYKLMQSQCKVNAKCKLTQKRASPWFKFKFSFHPFWEVWTNLILKTYVWRALAFLVMILLVLVMLVMIGFVVLRWWCCWW